MCDAVSLRIFESGKTVSRSDGAVNFAGGAEAATGAGAGVRAACGAGAGAGATGAGAAGATCVAETCGAGAACTTGAGATGVEPVRSMKSKTSSRVIRPPGPVPTTTPAGGRR